MRPPCLWTLLILALAAASTPCTAQEIRDPLIGTVLAPDGKPVTGARVAAFRAGGRGTGFLDLDYKNDFRRMGVTKTGKDGRFAMHLPVGLPCRITVDHKPYALFLREDCLPGDDIKIQLLTPATVTGQITLADGTPAKAKLRGWHRYKLDEVFRGETDKNGRFHFDRVAPGPIRIDIDPENAPSPRWLEVTLTAGQTFEHNVQLTAGIKLSGRVIDEATGTPLAGARIGEGWTLNRGVTTKADGTFEMLGYGSEGYQSVHCKADGYVKQVGTVSRKDGPQEIVFAMKRGHTTTGRVVNVHGKPVANTYVQVFGSARFNGEQYHNCLATRTAADGSFRIGGLRPDLAPVVVVRKDGYATQVYALPDAKNNVRIAGEIVLTPPRIVRGQLIGPDGTPRPNTAVALVGYNEDRHRLDPDGPMANNVGNARWSYIDMYVGRRKTRTDHLGRFAFGDVAPGDWQVTASTDQSNELARTAFTVKAKIDPKPIKLAVSK